ncbi:hypothetical protein Cgig2_028565 [Carnegiea gigantea]|uniref:CBS domain-containing protein n=1 Tax=Carnegiea gigantea TaxID=171969 RepID=A0A9Q1K3S6_9CARY|nr:hypothetical protein Cgig2_028565 [Carnegiea gigantea]
MAESLVNHVVGDLCLGKPSLRALSLSSTTTVGDALSALKSSQQNFISIWACSDESYHTNFPNNYPNINSNNNYENNEGETLGGLNLCTCVGKICMIDIICFLCKNENLSSPSAVLSPLSAILPLDSAKLVKHVDPSTSLLEAIDLIVQGAQNLVVPIQCPSRTNSRRKQPKRASNNGSTFHNGFEYCWLTLEDVVQFVLGRIGFFTPIPALSVETLGIIQDKVLTVDYHAPASMALDAIAQAMASQTSVGVVDKDGTLIGEISPLTLCGCDETVVAVIMTLSVGDLMAYIDWGGPPEDIIRVMKARLRDKKLDGSLEMLGDENSSYTSSSSSDDESLLSSPPSTKLTGYTRSRSYSARMVRKAEALVCHPGSSLVAVMVQAISHRVNYVLVVEENCTLVGIVTFRDMLKVFRGHLQTMIEEWDA